MDYYKSYRTHTTNETYRVFVDTRSAEVVDNVSICLIHQANFLLDQQIRRLENRFYKDGGLSERMTKAPATAPGRGAKMRAGWKNPCFIRLSPAGLVRTENANRPHGHGLIDPALKAAGWGIVAGSRIPLENPITLGRIVCSGRGGKVKLADGKERTIQHMIATSLWHTDGTPMSAAQFMEELFGKLPDFFDAVADLGMPQEISRIFVDFQQYLYQQAVA